MKRPTKRTIGSKIAERLKGFAKALQKREKLSERFTCRTITLEFKPQEYSPSLVKETRGKLAASQAIFARFLGVSLSTVRDWEQGLKTPTPIARRLMDEIRRDPDYWRKRLRELATRS